MSEAEGRSGRAARGVAINLLMFFPVLVAPAYHMLLVRALGPARYGVFVLAASMLEGASVFVLLGMDTAVRKYVAEAGDPAATHRSVGTALRSVVIAGAAVGAAMFAAAPSVAVWLRKPDIAGALRSLALVPMLTQCAVVLVASLQARFEMRAGVVARGFVHSAAMLALVALTWLTSAGVPGAALAVNGAALASLLGCAWFYDRRFGLRATLASALSGAVDRRMLGYGALMVVAGALWTASAKVDQVAVGRLQPAEQVGMYTACLMISALLPQLRAAFDPVVCAAIPGPLVRGDRAELRAVIAQQTHWLTMLAVPLYVGILTTGGPFLALLNPAFERGATALALVSTGQLLGIATLSPWVVSMGGWVRYVPAVAAATLSAQLALVSLLLPRLGVAGAALAAGTTTVLNQLLLAGIAWKKTGALPYSLAAARLLGLGLIAAFAAREIVALCFPRGGPLTRFLVGGCAGQLAFALLLLAAGLDTEERAALRALARRLGARR